MAVAATMETSFGEQRQLYIRLNNVEGVNNHASPGEARFRGFISRDAFLAGKHFVWERLVPFTPDISQPIWPQAYTALKAMPDMAGATDI